MIILDIDVFLYYICRVEYEDKVNVYDFGVILLEVIMGI